MRFIFRLQDHSILVVRENLDFVCTLGVVRPTTTVLVQNVAPSVTLMSILVILAAALASVMHNY